MGSKSSVPSLVLLERPRQKPSTRHLPDLVVDILRHQQRSDTCLFTANRYAPNCTPPPFLHFCGSNEAIMDQWLSRGVACTLPEAFVGKRGPSRFALSSRFSHRFLPSRPPPAHEHSYLANNTFYSPLFFMESSGADHGKIKEERWRSCSFASQQKKGAGGIQSVLHVDSPATGAESQKHWLCHNRSADLEDSHPSLDQILISQWLTENKPHASGWAVEHH